MAKGPLLASVLLFGLLPASLVPAADPPPSARIALIIDDLGNNRRMDERVVRLPGAVACAILPHTPHATRIAHEAHRLGKEVLLHLPMESLNAQAPGPGALDTSMFEQELAKMLDYNLASVPHVVGINNHMGSSFMADAARIALLMREIHQRGSLFFIDSRTHATSVAIDAARALGVPALSRDIFLDHEITPAAIDRQMRTLIKLAHSRGYAVGIGHPHPLTLAALERWLPLLDQHGVQLISLSSMLDTFPITEASPWPVSLSP